jgi:hypothetical protein
MAASLILEGDLLEENSVVPILVVGHNYIISELLGSMEVYSEISNIFVNVQRGVLNRKQMERHVVPLAVQVHRNKKCILLNIEVSQVLRHVLVREVFAVCVRKSTCNLDVIAEIETVLVVLLFEFIVLLVEELFLVDSSFFVIDLNGVVLSQLVVKDHCWLFLPLLWLARSLDVIWVSMWNLVISVALKSISWPFLLPWFATSWVVASPDGC